jgi:hypothetical protein
MGTGIVFAKVIFYEPGMGMIPDPRQIGDGGGGAAGGWHYSACLVPGTEALRVSLRVAASH